MSSSHQSILSLLSSYHRFSLKQIRDATKKGDHRGEEYGKAWDLYFASINFGDSKSEKVSVSVKLFAASSLSNGEFENEVRLAIRIQHPNVISLLGYCLESNGSALVFEDIERSLSNFMNKRSTFSLSWKQRLKMCLGAAYGLQHLHKETIEFPEGIIHKHVHDPGAILLDENLVAKFSSLYLYPGVHTNYTTRLCIDRGVYYSPEYLIAYTITQKMDVYSFGMLLFEVLCRQKPWAGKNVSYEEIEKFWIWAQKNVDIEIAKGISDDSLNTYVNAIRICLQSNPEERPTMDQVALLLEIAIICQEGEGEPVLNIDPIDIRKEEVTKSTSPTSSSSSSCELRILPLMSSCPQFSLAEIKDATDNFKVVIGKGGEAKVYKAEIHLNREIVRTPVAVKQLLRESSEFEKEILTVTKIRHPNIVSLLGFCNESDEKILIYEYMGKGSLSAYVKMGNPFCLTWKQRLNICLGAAYGLQYIHKKTDECQKGMIHRDVKPANILLDDNWVAKVSDFGTLKLSSSDETNSVISASNLSGTPGYYAPEYAFYKRLSTKVDVYSFGMVMFEVLCRRKKWDLEQDRSSYSYMEENENIGLLAQENVDKKIKDDISYNSLNIFTDTIKQCLQIEPNKRPTMDGVVQLLQSALKFQEGEDEQILSNNLNVVRVSEFDMLELESPFRTSNELKKVQLDQENGAKYFESMLTYIDIPLPDFLSAIFSWDASTLKSDDVENVIKSCPTKDQMEMLKNYNGDEEMLGKHEQFFLKLVKFPRLESKLGVFCFSMTFSHQVNDLRQSMEAVNVATIEVKGSKKLRQVIQIILNFWNSQNQGTAPGFDQRFKLGSLLKLSKTRVKNSKMTMMCFLCKHIAETKPELLDFEKDLVHLDAAAEIDIQTLAEEIQALRDGLQNVQREVTASDNDGFISASFQKVMRSFLDTAEAEVNSLTTFYSEVRRNLDTLFQYFAEDPVRYPFELVATTLLKFTRMFITEHQLIADLENKKLEQNP